MVVMLVLCDPSDLDDLEDELVDERVHEFSLWKRKPDDFRFSKPENYRRREAQVETAFTWGPVGFSNEINEEFLELFKNNPDITEKLSFHIDGIKTIDPTLVVSFSGGGSGSTKSKRKYSSINIGITKYADKAPEIEFIDEIGDATYIGGISVRLLIHEGGEVILQSYDWFDQRPVWRNHATFFEGE